MRSPKQARSEETNQRILDAAEELILQQGFSATRVEEVCGRAGVAKGGFFHHFKSKEDLGRAVLLRFHKRGLTGLRGDPNRQFESAVESLRDFLSRLVHIAKHPLVQRGCVVGICGRELTDVDEDFRRLVSESFAETRGFFIELFEAALRESGGVEPVRARDFADQLLALIQGSLVLIKGTGDQEIMARNIEGFRSFVDMVLAKEVGAAGERSTSNNKEGSLKTKKRGRGK